MKGNVLLSSNWANGDSDAKLPIFPKLKVEKSKGFIRTMLHIKDYEQTFNWYGVASWIAALDVAAIGYKTDKWNLSRLDNSFKGSGVLILGGSLSPDEEKKFQEDFNANMTGEGSTGKILTITKEGEVSGSAFTEIGQSVTEGDWKGLHEQSKSDLIISHEWYRSLAGLVDNTGFDTNRIRNEYEVALNSLIYPMQSFFLENFNKVFKNLFSFDFEAWFKNVQPVSIASQINVNKVITKRQALNILGIDEDLDSDINLNELVDNGNNTTIN